MTTEHSPSLWKRAALRDCCFRPEYGYTASASQEPVGPKFLRITDIQNGQVEWNKVPYVEKPEDAARSYLLETGDIVIARIGATTGKAFLESRRRRWENVPNNRFITNDYRLLVTRGKQIWEIGR